MDTQLISLNNSYGTAVIDLILPIQQIEFRVNISIDDQPDLLDIEGSYLAGGGCFLGAFVNGELVGTIALIRFAADSGAIRKMFVKKEYRGKERGIASLLLQQLFSICREKGISHVYLGTVTVLQAAIRFYEKNGFELTERTALPAAFPLMHMDTVFFQKHITAV